MVSKEYFELLILGSNQLITLYVRTYLCKSVGTIVCVYVCKCQWRSEEGVELPAAPRLECWQLNSGYMKTNTPTPPKKPNSKFS